MMTSTGRFATPHASKYLQQLCKHFAHKVEVAFDETHGTVALGAGPAEIWADAEGLTAKVSGEDARAILEARYVIDKHLVPFAFRESFCGMAWVVDPV